MIDVDAVRHAGALPVTRRGIWIARAFLSATDQAFVAGANLVMSILLARWLSTEEYGAFAVEYSVLLFAGAIHTATLSEPMAVFGSGKYSGRFPDYFTVVITGTIILAVGFSLPLIGASLILGATSDKALGSIILGPSLAMPLVGLFWLARRALYVRARLAWAAAGGAVYFLVLVVCLKVLHSLALLSANTAFLGMALAAGMATVLYLRALRPSWLLGSVRARAEIIADHWGYARGALLGAVASWIPWNVHFLLLPLFIPIGQVAGLKVLFTSVAPLTHLLIAFSAVLLPKASSRFHERGWSALSDLIPRVILLYLLASGTYATIMLFEGPRILDALFGKAYSEVFPLSGLLTLVQVPMSVVIALSVLLNAAGDSTASAMLLLPNAVGTLLLGIVGAWLFGLDGVVAGLLITALITLAMARRSLIKLKGSRSLPLRTSDVTAGG